MTGYPPLGGGQNPFAFTGALLLNRHLRHPHPRFSAPESGFVRSVFAPSASARQDALWDAVHGAFGGKVAQEKIDGFKAAAGTVLYYTDRATVETLQAQWKLVTGSNPSPSGYRGDTRPVVYASYEMIRGSVKGAGWPANKQVDEGSFLYGLRARTGRSFDLPTEASGSAPAGRGRRRP